jgi:hypothetical protein
MGRKKISKIETRLNHPIRTRVDDKVYQRIESLMAKSNCHSIAEVVRRIVSNEKIVLLHRDMALQHHVHQLAGIRSELHSIGVNINQITHAFHSTDSRHEKLFHALKVGEEYAKVGQKVDTLIEMVDELGKKWLQR